MPVDEAHCQVWQAVPVAVADHATVVVNKPRDERQQHEADDEAKRVVASIARAHKAHLDDQIEGVAEALREERGKCKKEQHFGTAVGAFVVEPQRKQEPEYQERRRVRHQPCDARVVAEDTLGPHEGDEVEVEQHKQRADGGWPLEP